MTPEQYVQELKDKLKAQRQKRGIKTALERVMDLPTQDFMPLPDGRWPGGENLVDKWTRKLQRGSRCDLPLRPVQAVMLEEAAWAASQPEHIGGLFAVGVGKGKTLASLLIPEIFEAKRPLLIVPSSMRPQLEADIFMWSQHYGFRLRYENVIYYSDLSRPKATGLLRELNPDLIICDEAHNFRHSSAARTKRFIRYIQSKPGTRVVLMSGTMTGSSLSDYAHLSEIALRKYSPLPTHDNDIDIWGSVLNADGEPDDKAWAVLRDLCPQAADKHDVDMMRAAFRKRMATTPGVVSTITSSCDAEIVLSAAYPDTTMEIRQHMARLAEDWVLPNGESVVDALHMHRAATQMSCGFYYIWDWPGEPDEDWLHARRSWDSACRQYLQMYAREGCDSQKLLEDYVRAGGPAALKYVLEEWDKERHKEPPPVKAVWIDVTPVLYAVEWASKQDRAFIWFQSKAVGAMLAAFGIPVFDDGKYTPCPDKHPVCALSIAIFNKGRNFQAWDTQLVMEPGPNGATWQQKLGRTHRQGQLSPVVRCSIYQHTWANRQALEKAMRRARYIQGTTGEPQKLLQATRTF